MYDADAMLSTSVAVIRKIDVRYQLPQLDRISGETTYFKLASLAAYIRSGKDEL